MSYVPVDVVEVKAWGETVGAVALDEATGFYAFEYAPEWAAGDRELSPLLMPNNLEVSLFLDLAPETFYRLPPMLADSLPDRFGNALVSSWMQDRGVNEAEITPLDRLAYAASRSMGALEFKPARGDDSGQSTAVQLADLVSVARAAIVGDLSTTPKDSLRELIQVGTSAGGARAKAVVAYHPETGQMRAGQLDAPDGFEHWLIKLDGVTADSSWGSGSGESGAGYGKVEFAYYLMAVDAGIDMAESHLLPEGPRNHFMTKRFDRLSNGGRTHLQSLCGIAGLDFNMSGAHSYSQYFGTIDRLGLGASSREQAFRRVVFNIVALNRDDHTKNLAFLMSEQGRWSLAPAFDVTYAHNPAGRWTARHQMSLEGKREAIELDDLYRFADRFRVPGYKAIIADVVEATRSWVDYATRAGVGPELIPLISEDLDGVRL